MNIHDEFTKFYSRFETSCVTFGIKLNYGHWSKIGVLGIYHSTRDFVSKGFVGASAPMLL